MKTTTYNSVNIPRTLLHVTTSCVELKNTELKFAALILGKDCRPAETTDTWVYYTTELKK